jgi:thymidylate synthase
MFTRHKNAEAAFEYYYNHISVVGEPNENTRRITGVLMQIDKPLDFQINTPWRGWKQSYVDLEWKWYQSRDRSPKMVEDVAPIWHRMKNEDGLVNSNYGWQVHRNGAWTRVAEGLAHSVRTGEATRKHVITIYDSKEKAEHDFDTPCTISLSFILKGDELIMHSHMRSNDLWFGFCNDIPAFALFQKQMVDDVNALLGNEGIIEPSYLMHFVDDLHIYNDKLGLDK